MTNDIATEVLKRVMKWMLIVFISIAFGYFWCYKALADYEAPVKAGWALSKDDPVRLAMNRMGPLYHYKMVGETLYVKPNEEWLRLKYR